MGGFPNLGPFKGVLGNHGVPLKGNTRGYIGIYRVQGLGFPKIRDTFSGIPINKDVLCVLGSILGSPQ